MKTIPYAPTRNIKVIFVELSSAMITSGAGAGSVVSGAGAVGAGVVVLGAGAGAVGAGAVGAGAVGAGAGVVVLGACVELTSGVVMLISGACVGIQSPFWHDLTTVVSIHVESIGSQRVHI